MRIWATDKGTEITLDVQEQRNLRKVTKFLATLAKHDGGEQERAAAEALAPIAAKWAPEEKSKERADAKK